MKDILMVVQIDVVKNRTPAKNRGTGSSSG